MHHGSNSWEDGPRMFRVWIMSLMILFYFMMAIQPDSFLYGVPMSRPGTHGSTPTKPDDFLPYVRIENTTLFDYLNECPEKWNANMNRGFVFYKHPLPPKQFSLTLTSVTVHDLLDAITAADGVYTWTYSNEVFSFAPMPSKVDVADRILLSKLDREISHFEVVRVLPQRALEALGNQARADGLTDISIPDGWELPKDWERCTDDFRISISVSSKTLRECLNLIVASDPPLNWLAVLDKQHLGLGISYGVGRHDHGIVCKPQPDRRAIDRPDHLNPKRNNTNKQNPPPDQLKDNELK